MNTPPPIEPDEPLVFREQIASSSLERMIKRFEERSAAFLKELEVTPTIKTCEACSSEATLNIEQSKEKMEFVYHCPTCEERLAQRLLGEKIERVGIPEDIRHATLENFQLDRTGIKEKYQTPADFLKAARMLAAGEARNAIFAGTPGIGKGHLAGAIAISFIRQGKRVAWIDCSHLFKIYHQAYSDNSTELIIDNLSAVDLLVMDEICLRDLPADGEEILFGILDRRHKWALQTILLANKPADEIKKWLGGRVADRLRSGTVVFRYGEWDSMRGGAGDGSNGDF